MYFDPIGFFIPLVAAVTYFLRVLRWAGWGDWCLALIATGISWITTSFDSRGLHMFEVYVFVIVYYVIKNQNISIKSHPPAGAILSLFFLTMIVPDLIGALHHYQRGGVAIVGGDRFIDGLFLWPIGSSMVYCLICAVRNHPRLNQGVQLVSWRQYLFHHFALHPSEKT